MILRKNISFEDCFSSFLLIKTLQAQLKELANTLDGLHIDLTDAKESYDKVNSGLKKAQDLRDGENKVFRETESSLSTMIENCGLAITAIQGDTFEDSLVQVRIGIPILKILDLVEGRQSQTISKILSSSRRAKLRDFTGRVTTGEGEVSLLQERKTSESGTHGEIIGILKQTQKDSEDSLRAIRKNEASSQETFNKLKLSKKNELESVETQLEEKRQAHASAKESESVAFIEENDVKKSLAVDKKGLNESEALCEKQRVDHESSIQGLETEASGINKAIQIFRDLALSPTAKNAAQEQRSITKEVEEIDEKSQKVDEKLHEAQNDHTFINLHDTDTVHIKKRIESEPTIEEDSEQKDEVLAKEQVQEKFDEGEDLIKESLAKEESDRASKKPSESSEIRLINTSQIPTTGNTKYPHLGDLNKKMIRLHANRQQQSSSRGDLNVMKKVEKHVEKALKQTDNKCSLKYDSSNHGFKLSCDGTSFLQKTAEFLRGTQTGHNIQPAFEKTIKQVGKIIVDLKNEKKIGADKYDQCVRTTEDNQNALTKLKENMKDNKIDLDSQRALAEETEAGLQEVNLVLQQIETERQDIKTIYQQEQELFAGEQANQSEMLKALTSGLGVLRNAFKGRQQSDRATAVDILEEIKSDIQAEKHELEADLKDAKRKFEKTIRNLDEANKELITRRTEKKTVLARAEEENRVATNMKEQFEVEMMTLTKQEENLVKECGDHLENWEEDLSGLAGEIDNLRIVVDVLKKGVDTM